MLTPEQEQIIQRSVLSVRALLQHIEANHSKTVVDKSYPGGQIICVQVDAPQVDQLQEAYNRISIEVRGVEQTALEDEMRNRLEKELQDFTSYPSDKKLIFFQVPNDRSRPVGLTEFFVNDTSEVQVTPNGGVSWQSGLQHRADKISEGEDSWAKQRYSHLFIVEREQPPADQ